MDNHYHLVLFVDESQANAWDDNEIYTRWAALFAADAKNLENSVLASEEIQERILVLRQRLMSLSWFMKCLNEEIARLSNCEEGLSGRFWEGRFKSQALLDEGAVLAAMAYVDLNPIRAKIAQTPEESEFTSIYERIKAVCSQLKKEKSLQNSLSLSEMAKQCDDTQQPIDLIMLSDKTDDFVFPKIDFSLSDYFELVDYTGRILREDKKGVIPNKLMPILFRLHLTPQGWINMTSHLEEKFFDAIGNPKSLIEFKRASKRKPKGFNSIKQYYQNVA